MSSWRSGAAWSFAEAKSIVLKEFIKWAVLGLLAIVGGWLLATVKKLFDPEGPLAQLPVWERAKRTGAELLSDPIGYLYDLVRNDPGLTIAAIVLCASYAILFMLLRRAKWRLKEASVERELAIEAGIGGRWPHAKTAGNGGAPWPDLCAEISRHDNAMLLLIGANGAETFGKTSAPLFDVMQNFRGPVRVILTDPDSQQTAGRATAVSVSVAEYRRSISLSVKRLKDLRKQQHPIEGRYYDGQPNWKMIITSRTAWVQYYHPGQHVDETPVWRFDATDHGNGLYHLFKMEFERIWHRCEGNEMALN